jgi:hypothetical protein
MGFKVRLLEDSFALVAPKGDVLVATVYRHVDLNSLGVRKKPNVRRCQAGRNESDGQHGETT